MSAAGGEVAGDDAADMTAVMVQRLQSPGWRRLAQSVEESQLRAGRSCGSLETRGADKGEPSEGGGGGGTQA